jgi:hypothetical protein
LQLIDRRVLLARTAQARQHIAIRGNQPVQDIPLGDAGVVTAVVTGPKRINPLRFDVGQGMEKIAILGEAPPGIFGTGSQQARKLNRALIEPGTLASGCNQEICIHGIEQRVVVPLAAALTPMFSRAPVGCLHFSQVRLDFPGVAARMVCLRAALPV